MREQNNKQQGKGEHNKRYNITPKIETEVDHALTLAWMWDTQDVTCPPHPHQQKQFPSPVANKSIIQKMKDLAHKHDPLLHTLQNLNINLEYNRLREQLLREGIKPHTKVSLFGKYNEEYTEKTYE